MSLLSESGRRKLQAFEDWVNADSFDIPPEIVYPEKVDDHHGHGGHDDHGHEEHHDDAHHEEHHDDAHHEEHHCTPSLPQPSREEVRKAQVEAVNLREEEKRRARADKMAALEKKRAEKRGPEKPKEAGAVRFYNVAAIITGFIVAAVLIITVAFLPPSGSENAPDVNEVTERYLSSGLSETGATNAVAGIILDYRAFDTLGESMVLFTATVTVLFLLYQFKRDKKEGIADADDAEHYGGIRSLPAKVCFRISIPYVLLYGIYVVVNGHLSPGGGFSGGTILGSAFVLSHLAFGEEYTARFINVNRCMKIMATGLFVYIALKTYHVLTGANGIASAIPLGTPGSIFSAGLIFPLNICVGLVVACTIFALYHLFTAWKA